MLRVAVVLLLLPLTGCLSGPQVPAHTDADDAVRFARGALPGWDPVYLSAGGSPDRPGEAESWRVGMARGGEVAVVVVRGDGVRVAEHPGSDRVVRGGEVLVEGPWGDGGAPHEALGDGWRTLDALPEPDGLHWLAFLHGAEPRWERMRVESDGNLVFEAFDARTGEPLPALAGLSAREAVARWRDAGGEGNVTGLSSVGYGSGFASPDAPWRDGSPTTMPLLVAPDHAVGDGRSTQWLLAAGNVTWRVDAGGAVRLDDGLLDAAVPLGDWVDSTEVVGSFDHSSGSMLLHADAPGRPVWSLWTRSGDTIDGGDIDARPVPVLRLQGTVWESGRAHPPAYVCGASLPVVEVDEAARRIEYRPGLPVHTEHDLFVLDDVQLVLLDGGCNQETLRSGNGTVATPWDGLTATLEAGGVRVGDVLLRPGDTANVTVHWSVTETRHGEEGTWEYDGDLRVTWLGTWPRGNITATLGDP